MGRFTGWNSAAVVKLEISRNSGSKPEFAISKKGKRDDLGIYVRSTWEANYARYLNWLVKLKEILSWKYENKTFEFPVKKGTRFYTPDFEVLTKNNQIEYHEVKGYMTQKGQTALNRMSKYYPQIKIIMVQKKEYEAIAKIKNLIDGWERG